MWWKIRFLASGAALILLLFFPTCKGSEIPAAGETPPGSPAASAEIQPVVVSAAVAREVPIERRAQIVGTLLADEEVTLSNEVAGTIQTVEVDFGSRVREGQLLMTLDPTEYRLDVERAEQALNQALAVLGLPPDGDESRVVVETTPGFLVAEAALADARNKLESARQLIETKDIPDQRYLELQKSVEQREATLRQARDQVQTQIAAVRFQRAQLAIERNRLSDTRIQAPFSGSVAMRHVSPGQYLRENSPLLTIVRNDPLRLRGRVPETGAALVRVGVRLNFQTDAYPGRSFEVLVSSVSPVLDASSRTLIAEARVPNPDGLLKPGMFTKIDVVLEESSPAILIPRESVLAFAGINKIFVIGSDGTVEERTVELGIEKDGRIEVLGGAVRSGESVAVDQLDLLKSGMVVQVKAT